MSQATASATLAYRQRSILSATPEQLVVMLYDGCVRFLMQGAASMREHEISRTNERLQRAEAILDELLATLNMEAGGEVSANLRDLYLFCRRHLNEARVRQQPELVDEVAGLMRDLSTAWAELATR